MAVPVAAVGCTQLPHSIGNVTNGGGRIADREPRMIDRESRITHRQNTTHWQVRITVLLIPHVHDATKEAMRTTGAVNASEMVSDCIGVGKQQQQEQMQQLQYRLVGTP